MKFQNLLILFILTLCLCSCRSEADRMAEFCMHFEEATDGTEDCTVMAQRLTALLESPQPYLKDAAVCDTPKACDSYKRGAHKLLCLCGHDETMKPVLSQMHFSTTLREQKHE